MNGRADAWSGRVMGTTASVIVHGGSVEAGELASWLAALERRWSRFLPDSEISRWNSARLPDDRAGVERGWSADTRSLVARAGEARRLTEGRFDAWVADRMVALGYDRTYRELPSERPPALSIVAEDAHRPFACFDPGGLGKGFAADLTAGRAMDAGAHGVLVEVGGDVVTRGWAPDGGPWVVEAERSDGGAVRIELLDGAVATSDPDVRTWTVGSRRIRHVIDPLDGTPVRPVGPVTIVAGEGWWAEAVATAALVSRSRGDGWFDEARAHACNVEVVAA
ncbi:MAG TPA: FAD:protein FMN transferase [Microthrixaceae bacterium]|nr:FAD:protein FMN transferase [Microthrixaceae bacterium]HMT23335.1 FAD:protein FMN transferase [Microthrixaceae bacterium]